MNNMNTLSLPIEKSGYQFGVLFRLKSFWIGWHYSNKCKRLCVNLIPCVTFWISAKDGLPPDLNKM